MSKPKHTPGPWVLVDNLREPPFRVIEIQVPRGGIGLYTLGSIPVDVPRDRADARLIAAAPELLEALKRCQAAMRAHEIEFCQAYKDAEAAIAKAEGGDE